MSEVVCVVAVAKDMKSRGVPRLFYVIYLFRHIYDFHATLHR